MRTETKTSHNPKTDVWRRGKICGNVKLGAYKGVEKIAATPKFVRERKKKSIQRKKTVSTGEKIVSTLKQLCDREQKFDTVLILRHRQSGKTSTAEKQMLGQKEKIASILKQMLGREGKFATT